MPAKFVMFMALLMGSSEGMYDINIKVLQNVGNSLGDGGSGGNSGNSYLFGDSGGNLGNSFVTTNPPPPGVGTAAICGSMSGSCQAARSPCLGMIIDNPRLVEKYCGNPPHIGPFCCAPSGQVFKADIENSLSYALRRIKHHLFYTTRDKAFNSNTCAAFKEFIRIISKYLNIDNTDQHIQGHTHRFINSLDHALSVKVGSFNWNWLESQLHFTQTLPSTFINGKWHPSVSCHNIHGDDCFWRYTCGLWNIFHTLTVSAGSAVDPLEVLEAIHGYVVNFLGCSKCAGHFESMYSQTIVEYNSVGNTDEAILWLWCAHNTVNQNYTSKNPWPTHPPFPIKSVCPWCWRKAMGPPGVTTCSELFCRGKKGKEDEHICFRTPDDPIITYDPFYTPAVLLYLKGTYGGLYSDLNIYTGPSETLHFDPKPTCPIYV